MPLAVRYHDSPRPQMRRVPKLAIRRIEDASFMADLQGRTPEQMQARFANEHRAYVAFIGAAPAAWGWVATRSADIGELGATIELPAGDRYLWNFVTLKPYRGMGIYGCLLDAIMQAETEAARFWIAYAPENFASGAGIRRAGFETVAELSFDAAGRATVRPLLPEGGAQLLGLPVSGDALTPCWRCVRAGRIGHYCPDGACSCDYQRPEAECHA